LTAKEVEENTDALAAAHVGDESFETVKRSTGDAYSGARLQLLAFGKLDQAVDLTLANSIDNACRHVLGTRIIAYDSYHARRAIDLVPLQLDPDKNVAGKKSHRPADQPPANTNALSDPGSIRWKPRALEISLCNPFAKALRSCARPE
jgi:hypothetical protein